MSFSPKALYIPAGHSSQVVVDVTTSVLLYLPGPQDEQVDDPALLKPVPHVVQASVAPVEKEFTGQITLFVWTSFDMYPAGTVEQNAAPARA